MAVQFAVWVVLITLDLPLWLTILYGFGSLAFVVYTEPVPTAGKPKACPCPCPCHGRVAGSVGS